MNSPPQLRDPFAGCRHPITGEPCYNNGQPIPSSERAAIIRNAEADYLRRMDKYHGVIHSLSELKGFTVQFLMRYKPGVVRYFAYRGNEQRSGLVKDSVFSEVQLPP